jgi:hypothetical protein
VRLNNAEFSGTFKEYWLLYVRSLCSRASMSSGHARGHRAGIVMRLEHSFAAVRGYAFLLSCKGDVSFIEAINANMPPTLSNPFLDELATTHRQQASSDFAST